MTLASIESQTAADSAGTASAAEESPSKPRATPKSKIKNPNSKISQAQLAANRANAQKSTGPRTPEGKAKSRLNRLKHGLRASPTYRTLLPNECSATHCIFERELEEELRPISALQNHLFMQIANTLWMLQRIPQAQAYLHQLEQPDDESLPPDAVLALRFFEGDASFARLHRYQKDLQNQFLKFMREYRVLQKEQTKNPVRYPDEKPLPLSNAEFDRRIKENNARLDRESEQEDARRQAELNPPTPTEPNSAAKPPLPPSPGYSGRGSG